MELKVILTYNIVIDWHVLTLTANLFLQLI